MKTFFSSVIKKIDKLFLLVVAVPFFLAVVYYGFIVSDVYISESKFVVRSADKQSATGLGAILKGVGFSNSHDDSYAVHDYILSRDALTQLQTSVQLADRYKRDNIDTFSRYDGLLSDNSFESLFKYFNKHVNVDFDSASAITKLTVRAYDPKDSAIINQQLLLLSETLVNRINDTARSDQIVYAEKEVQAAEQRAKSAAVAVSSYRNQNQVFNPEGQSGMVLQQITKLQDQLMNAKMQLAQVQSLTPDNPQLTTLQAKVDAIQFELNKQNNILTGAGQSLSNKSTSFQRMTLEKEFADKQLLSALATLQQAKNDVGRKQLYLERIVEPNTPDDSAEPRRIRSIFSILALSIIIWLVTGLLLAAVKDHKD